MAKAFTLPKVVIRTKKVKTMENGSVMFNARSIEVDGKKLPFVSDFSVGQEGHGLLFLTVKIPCGDLQTITEE